MTALRFMPTQVEDEHAVDMSLQLPHSMCMLRLRITAYIIACTICCCPTSLVAGYAVACCQHFCVCQVARHIPQAIA